MCINKLREYCDKWKLTVNLEKTKVIIPRANGKRHDAQFLLGNKKL